MKFESFNNFKKAALVAGAMSVGSLAHGQSELKQTSDTTNQKPKIESYAPAKNDTLASEKITSLPDSLAKSVDQVLENHLAEQKNTLFKDYKESFSGKSLFDWTDKELLKKYYDHFESEFPVVLAKDSKGGYSMIINFGATDGNPGSYVFKNIPDSLVENYINQEAKIISKNVSKVGYNTFEQNFPATFLAVSGKTGVFSKADINDFFHFAHQIEVVETR